MRPAALFGFASLLLAASVLGAVGGSPFEKVGRFIDRQFAFVGGINASVEPNEVNLLAQELGEKERQLNAREAELSARESMLTGMLQDEVRRSYLGIIAFLAVSVLFLLGLIGLNFYLDARRRERQSENDKQKGELLIRL
jgi:hypothetical protein